MRDAYSNARLNPLGEIAPYADLPDEVLQEVLGRTAEVADAVRSLFTRVDERRVAMREALIDQDQIRHLRNLPEVRPARVAAVDGGAAMEKALGADTALAVAVGVEGLTDSEAPDWPGVQYAAWQKTLPHSGEETAATCRGIMTALELAVLRSAPHDVVLLDGSHLTPVIALNAMLGVTQDALRAEIAEAVTRHDTADALRAVMTAPAVVAVVKYDGSRDLSQTFLPPDVRGPGLGLDDRTTLSLLLDEGEYTTPQPLALTQQSKNNWLTKHIEALTPADAAREAVRVALNETVTLVRDDRLLATYFKPHAWSPAFRLEIKPEVAESPERMAKVLGALRTQVVSPEIREPYPQWVADRMAKSVGDALVALRTAVNFDLTDAGMGEYVALVAHSYRTEAI
jgi:NurA domain.